MEYIKKNIHWLISVNVAIFVIMYAYGCEAKTTSMIYPERKVTRSELTTELELLESKSNIAYNDLERQERIRDIVLNQSLIVAQGGTVNPVGVIMSIMSVLGIGVAADDVRLRKKIKDTIRYEPVGPNDPK
ncbi:hypothetical protein KAR91_15850 [Candidatus Pacearchaeota archaeon]|nr:hypothetical protein [Candidatus Pacearchaeota archaeon]